MANLCALCGKSGLGEMKMVQSGQAQCCNHSFCSICFNQGKVVVGGKCPAPSSIEKQKCGQVIASLLTVGIKTELSGLRDQVAAELETIETEKELLRNVKDGIVSFTKNLINSSSQLVERNVRCLQSDQQEKIEILRKGKIIADAKVEAIKKNLTRAEQIQKGANKKSGEFDALKSELENLVNYIAEFSVNTIIYENVSNTSLDPNLITVPPVHYGMWSGAVNQKNKVVDGVAMENATFFPPTYLPSHYLTTHLVPPYMDFFFIIPNFFEACAYPNSISSPVFQTLPFLMKWKFIVFPHGNKFVKENQERVSVGIELVNGNEPEVAAEFKNLFPEYGGTASSFPNYNPSAASSSASSSSSSSSLPSDPSVIGADSIAAVMRNPFVFDYKIQLIAPAPNADASKRIHSYESTANFEKKDPDKQGRTDFITKKKVEDDGFLWTDEKFPDSLHFIFGIRFPSFKREYEALRVAYSFQKKPKGKKK